MFKPLNILLRLLSISPFVVITSVNGECFGANGQPRDPINMQPCDPSAKYSACCATAQIGPDVCRTTGLCQPIRYTYPGLVFQNGCTDPTGKSPECPSFCNPVAPVFGKRAMGYAIEPCKRGVWCCRDPSDKESCCQNRSLLITDGDIGRLFLSEIKTIGNAGNNTYPTSDSTSNSSPAPSGGSYAPEKCSNTATLGVGISLGIGLAIALGAIARMAWQQAVDKRKLEKQKRGLTPISQHLPVHELGIIGPQATKLGQRIRGPQPAELEARDGCEDIDVNTQIPNEQAG
ncbi:hypothetical protein P152DRAFT_462386 [Eremomyces bilateralis CBS 781.70]|uniref:Mid2 domain-containing protein n=1 Tax=Eremomyces bilateralis CBS 781.70 TaxID=1392243 RepID=A0A6G1FS65_9PEZI|nr:uncharacterized protein P152DRAFT_462386 [Eremomyces bilateralis CBS 781.70]KAF1808519.1 hypothetical protein P152DRAFT_462386 [Eremomyces bilateralis CBS 781.70]